MTTTASIQCTLSPADNRRLADLCGPHNQHLLQVEKHFDVEIRQRGDQFNILGATEDVQSAHDVLQRLYAETNSKNTLTAQKIHLFLSDVRIHKENQHEHKSMSDSFIKTDQMTIRPRGQHQQAYIKNIHNNAINFGVGPAGTGKTYLAVASGIEALSKEQVKRLIFVRPAVEAGENLGFLPGDLEEKILPYLRPLYDAMYEMLGVDRVAKLIEQNIIELAPLAYMRGRTLNDAFIILDEAQNTTTAQMKMFLTRIGFGSTAVITGDVTQIDLKDNSESGLLHAIKVLKDINHISFNYFNAKDTVRHPLVQSVIEAYDKHDKKS